MLPMHRWNLPQLYKFPVLSLLIENLKKLPPSKQEYVNGYVQGIADTIAEKAEQQKTA